MSTEKLVFCVYHEVNLFFWEWTSDNLNVHEMCSYSFQKGPPSYFVLELVNPICLFSFDRDHVFCVQFWTVDQRQRAVRMDITSKSVISQDGRLSMEWEVERVYHHAMCVRQSAVRHPIASRTNAVIPHYTATWIRPRTQLRVHMVITFSAPKRVRLFIRSCTSYSSLTGSVGTAP